MEYPEVEITKEDLRKIAYFSVMKFKADALHMQGTSSKRDLVGGYIERWFNKIAETSIFDNLLRGKSYRVISDYFLYANDSDKNAPDILGLEKSGLVIPFVKHKEGTWETISGMPRVEVKVLRKDQMLAGVRDAQMIDDYYIFIESDLEEDYLTALFEGETFNDRYFQELETKQEFIESDTQNQIIEHMKATPAQRIGTMKLIGTYTREELKNNSILCKKDTSPYYFGNVENRTPSGSLVSEPITLDDRGRLIYKYDDKYVLIPLTIENPNNSEITIVKKNKGSVFLHSISNIVVNGKEVDGGNIVIEFKKFERSSKWDEHIVLKSALKRLANDSTAELVALFDSIARAN